MSSDSKAITKLKKRSSKWPWETGLNGFKNQLLQVLPASLILFLLRNTLVESDYKLKRESIKFFKFSVMAYGANKRRRCHRLLVIAFALNDRHFDVNYVALIRNAVRATLERTENRRNFSESILEATKNLKISTLDATGWYQLSRGLFSLGYFRAAWVARENSLDSSISEAILTDSSSTSLIRGIQAYLERVNLFEAKKIVEDKRDQLPAKYLASIQNFVSSLERSHIYWSKVDGSHKRNGEDLFKDLITDKTVAVVGPGAPHDDYGLEIDNFDIVIRIKFIGSEIVDLDNRHGTRTDVSFIAAIDAIKLQEKELQKSFSNIRLIISNHTLVNSICSVPIYEIEDDSFLYRTPTTSGIRVLYETLKFSPSRVKVFGFDFYSTLTPYSKEMTEFYEKSAWRFGHPNDFVADGVYFKFMRALDFSEHDPVSNFCFAQNLYKAGRFDIEPYGKSILELTPYQYVERLEEMLGDW